MTLEALEELERETLLPAEVAAVLGCNAYNFTLQAREDAGRLGFPVCIIGNRVRTPRRAFINWLKNGGTKDEAERGDQGAAKAAGA